MPGRVQYQSPASASTASSDSISPPPQLGSILYRGPVPPTKGEWLGIEWDDPLRGKHSGVHDKTGVRYFETRVGGAGSFLRPNAPGLVLEGLSFKEAFESKYLDQPTTSDPVRDVPPQDEDKATTSRFYKTLSNFEIEVVSSEKVAARFRHLGRLREAGLEWEALDRACQTNDEAGGDELAEFGKKLSGLEFLHLSCTLLPSLVEVERIARALPKLAFLSLNSNRFESIRGPTALPGFERLTTLKLNSTLLTWPEVIRISPSLPNLVNLELGFNRLTRLDHAQPSSAAKSEPVSLPKLEILNLEMNELHDMEETILAVSGLPSLKKLVLASNRFETLSLASRMSTTTTSALRQLRHLSLTSNLLSSWSDSIDALGEAASTTFPALNSLSIADNPLSSDLTNSRLTGPTKPTYQNRRGLDTRLLIIARLGFLDTLEGTAITEAEREDAERYWIREVQASQGGFEGLSEWANGRLEALRKKHALVPAIQGKTGTLSSAHAPAAPATLKSRLIRLRVALEPLTSTGPPDFDPILELSVLPTLRTLMLRSQLSRLLGKPLPKTKYRLIGWLKAKDSDGKGREEDEKWMRVEISTKEEGREVGWWGFEEGDAVAVEEA
ncbi:hypothetical protein JCM16303_004281 [Sporobolomyces ruberrimus]